MAIGNIKGWNGTHLRNQTLCGPNAPNCMLDSVRSSEVNQWTFLCDLGDGTVDTFFIAVGQKHGAGL